MAEKLPHLTIEQFLDRLGAAQPTPGGGAAACLSGALAAALGHMCCQYTRGEKYAAVEAEIEQLAHSLRRAEWMLRAMIDEDALAYGALSAALKRPKDDDERPAAVSTAATAAALIPLQAAAVCRRVRSELRRLAEIVNRNLASDVRVAGHLCGGALASSVENVKVNLPLIREQDRGAIERELAGLAGE